MTIPDAEIEAAARALCRLRVTDNIQLENSEPNQSLNKKRVERYVEYSWQDWVRYSCAALEAAKRVRLDMDFEAHERAWQEAVAFSLLPKKDRDPGS